MAGIRGTYCVKCVKPGGHAMAAYTWSEGEEIDLLDEATVPATLFAGTYITARRMCEDQRFELAQLIAAGDFVVMEKVQQDRVKMQNDLTSKKVTIDEMVVQPERWLVTTQSRE